MPIINIVKGHFKGQEQVYNNGEYMSWDTKNIARKIFIGETCLKLI